MMKIMKVVNWSTIKLGVGTGLVLGMGSMLAFVLMETNFDRRWWQWLRELLGLGLGITYVFLQWREIRRQLSWVNVAEKYTMYIYWTVLAWLGWYLLLWVLDAWRTISNVEAAQLMGIAGNRSVGNWVGWIIGVVVEAVRLIGWGLIPVIGYWKLNSNGKTQKSKL